MRFCPNAGKLDDDLAAVRMYEVGKPLVIEEVFPLSAGLEETGAFIIRPRAHVYGCISFYWGKTIEEYEKAGDLNRAVVGGWLQRFRSMSQYSLSDGKKK